MSTDKNDELMAEFRRLRDETQPIHNDLMALTPTPIINQPDGQLLRELQLMRTEMKQIQNEMNEKLEKMRMEVAEVKSNQEVSKNDQEELRRNQDSVKESQEFVKNCLQEVKASHVDLKKTVTDNLNILKTKIESVSTQINKMNGKVPETNCLPTIKEQFFGKWKSAAACYNEILSFKFIDNKLIIKWGLCANQVYTLGVKHADWWTVHLEGEKIVQTLNDWKREFYLEDGSLVYEERFNGVLNSKFTFKRIGDPDV